MKIVEVTENKIEKLSSMVEEMLNIGGKVMSCISQLGEQPYERQSYQKEGRYGNYQEDRDYDYRRNRM